MSDPRIVGLTEALAIIDDLGKAWPEDMFGPDLNAAEWATVRAAGIPTERIASACYRHALRVAAHLITDAIAEHRAEEADA